MGFENESSVSSGVYLQLQKPAEASCGKAAGPSPQARRGECGGVSGGDEGEGIPGWP